jgi:hypothetical protein
MSTSQIRFQYADYQETVIEELENGASDVVVLRTGYGGGKSYCGAQWIHEGSLQLSEGESLVLAPDFSKGGPATYRVFFETLPGENTVPNDAGGDPENSPIIAGYNQNQNRVTYSSGHVVRLGSADRWNRYAGSEFHRIWMDEPSHYENTDLYDLHEMLISRQRTHQGPNTCLWTSTGNGYNQFYDITERKVEPDGEGDEQPLSWQDTMTVFVFSSLRNPFLPGDAKQKLQRQFEGTDREEQALHGGFAAARGLVYSQFSRNTHVVDDDTLPELRSKYYYGYDHGWDDPRVLLEIRKTEYDQYAIVGEFYESETTVEEGIQWLDEPGTIYSEHEPDHIEKFKQAGYHVEKAIKDLDEGIPLVREFLEVDDDGRPGLLVHEDCVNTIQEFLSYKEEHVGKSKAQDHALDALRYSLATRELDSSGFAFGHVEY